MNFVAIYFCNECQEDVHVLAPPAVQECVAITKFLDEKCSQTFEFKLVCDECFRKLLDNEGKCKDVVHTKNFGC